MITKSIYLFFTLISSQLSLSLNNPTRFFSISTRGCLMPRYSVNSDDPYEKDENSRFVNCRSHPPIVQSDDGTLFINQEIKRTSAYMDVECCYKNFYRHPTTPWFVENSESMRLNPVCTPFNMPVQISDEFVQVICKVPGKKVQKDYHAFISLKNFGKIPIREGRTMKPSILIVSIGSLSHQGLVKNLPKTYKVIKKTGAFELSGFNSIGVPLYSNTHAMFTGFSHKDYNKKCSFGNERNCNYIWEKCHKKGYVTAFAEDSAFENLLSPFRDSHKPPTNFYSQNIMALHKILKLSLMDSEKRSICLEPILKLKVLFDYATKFTQLMTYEDLPFWAYIGGNSWTNSTFHLFPNADLIYAEFFKHLKQSKTLQNTVVFFVSDHGRSFKKFPESFKDYVEFRQPFAFMFVPDWIKREKPAAFANLAVNRRRLVTPYDIAATMMHVLNFSTKADPYVYKKGISLFSKIPTSRTCYFANIPDNLCTCQKFNTVEINDLEVQYSALEVVNNINNLSKAEREQCSLMELDQVESVILWSFNYAGYPKIFEMTIRCQPRSARYEAEIKFIDSPKRAVLVGDINRIGSYNDPNCTNNVNLSEFCVC